MSFPRTGLSHEGLSDLHYYPFGMVMPGTDYTDPKYTGGYRYGFNGKEMDSEVSGIGNQYDYGFRIYNPRLGKFLSVDPLSKSYPFYSPYHFSSNSPIAMVDLDGLEAIKYLETQIDEITGKEITVRVVELNVYVAISNAENSIHFKDSKAVQEALDNEYPDRKFYDEDNNPIEFRLNVLTYEISPEETLEEAAKTVAKNHSFKIIEEPEKGPKRIIPVNNSVLVAKAELPNTNVEVNGEEVSVPLLRGLTTSTNKFSVCRIDTDPLGEDQTNAEAHTIAHELLHSLLRRAPDVLTKDQHNEAGGLFSTGTYDRKTNTITNTEPLSKSNVEEILKHTPEKP